jgi:hypothetical protein
MLLGIVIHPLMETSYKIRNSVWGHAPGIVVTGSCAIFAGAAIPKRPGVCVCGEVLQLAGHATATVKSVMNVSLPAIGVGGGSAAAVRTQQIQRGQVPGLIAGNGGGGSTQPHEVRERAIERTRIQRRA